MLPNMARTTTLFAAKADNGQEVILKALETAVEENKASICHLMLYRHHPNDHLCLKMTINTVSDLLPYYQSESKTLIMERIKMLIKEALPNTKDGIGGEPVKGIISHLKENPHWLRFYSGS